ncbi:hypothetical protein NW752_008441 [Fusarium irregulare]|uniref:Uncharacterized protein n=1 Tax=Fusarium irregulare TaxID=2494466 RepID=A0A9W8PXM0_9HYPO|nr:hypothetical protein NW752_008441 [Fusarium irregulare]KAJ4020373.1 hypothetical protein NW766_001852 [Fusarium irregulare]
MTDTSSTPANMSPTSNSTLNKSDSESSKTDDKRKASHEVITPPKGAELLKNDKTVQDADTKDKTETEKDPETDESTTTGENAKNGKGTETEENIKTKEDTKKSDDSITESDMINYLFASHKEACDRVEQRHLPPPTPKKSSTRLFESHPLHATEGYIRSSARANSSRVHLNLDRWYDRPRIREWRRHESSERDQWE